MFVTLSESPVVVVLSGSMEPAFQRGDILFLNNAVEEVRTMVHMRDVSHTFSHFWAIHLLFDHAYSMKPCSNGITIT